MAPCHACGLSGWQQVAVQLHASRKFFPYHSVGVTIYFEMALIKVPGISYHLPVEEGSSCSDSVITLPCDTSASRCGRSPLWRLR